MAYNRYPQASEKGTWIPIDILGPSSAAGYTVTNTAMAAVIAVPGSTNTLWEIYCVEDCILSFDTVPINYSGNFNFIDAYILPAGQTRLIQAQGEQFSAMLLSATTAILVVNRLILWDKLTTEVQQSYG